MLQEDELGEWATPVYLYLPTMYKSQFQNHSQELLLYFSLHLSDHFEWDIILGSLEYEDTHSVPSTLNVYLPKAGFI